MALFADRVALKLRAVGSILPFFSGAACYIEFIGVKPEPKCPNLYSAESYNILGYSKDWNQDTDVEEFIPTVWLMVEFGVTSAQQCIHYWNDSLNLW